MMLLQHLFFVVLYLFCFKVMIFNLGSHIIRTVYCTVGAIVDSTVLQFVGLSTAEFQCGAPLSSSNVRLGAPIHCTVNSTA